MAQRVEEIRRRIREAAQRSGRRGDVALLAATKQVPPERVEEAVAAGVDALGENRVQEARLKLARFRGRRPLHMIGHLQRNKVKAAVEMFDVIQSVDSLDLAEALSRFSVLKGSRLQVYLEVNTSGEASKFGVAPERAAALARAVAALPGLDLTGLMTVGPLTEDEAAVRGAFRRLAGLRAEIAADVPRLESGVLSMGMSGDFEIAVEEGSNLVRIGTGIFGPRGA